jgi:hypothetical protein
VLGVKGLKVNFALEQEMNAQTCSVGADILFLYLGARRKSVARVPPRTFYPRKGLR